MSDWQLAVLSQLPMKFREDWYELRICYELVKGGYAERRCTGWYYPTGKGYQYLRDNYAHLTLVG